MRFLSSFICDLKSKGLLFKKTFLISGVLLLLLLLLLLLFEYLDPRGMRMGSAEGYTTMNFVVSTVHLI